MFRIDFQMDIAKPVYPDLEDTIDCTEQEGIDRLMLLYERRAELTSKEALEIIYGVRLPDFGEQPNTERTLELLYWLERRWNVDRYRVVRLGERPSELAYPAPDHPGFWRFLRTKLVLKHPFIRSVRYWEGAVLINVAAYAFQEVADFEAVAAVVERYTSQWFALKARKRAEWAKHKLKVLEDGSMPTNVLLLAYEIANRSPDV